MRCTDQRIRANKQKPPPSLAGDFFDASASGNYGAEDAADEAGASDDNMLDIAEEASEAIDESAELIADSSEEAAADDEDEASDEEDDITEDDDGAADEDGAASLELTTAELEGVTGFTGVGVPRLKIQIRPMITITATMMMIQVLRFIVLDLVGVTGPGS